MWCYSGDDCVGINGDSYFGGDECGDDCVVSVGDGCDYVDGGVSGDDCVGDCVIVVLVLVLMMVLAVLVMVVLVVTIVVLVVVTSNDGSRGFGGDVRADSGCS